MVFTSENGVLLFRLGSSFADSISLEGSLRGVAAVVLLRTPASVDGKASAFWPGSI